MMSTHLFGAGAELVEVGVAGQDHAAHGGAVVGEGGCERQPDGPVGVGRRGELAAVEGEAVVAEHQQVDPVGVADRLVLDGAEPGEADLDVGVARRLPGGVGVALGGRDERVAPGALDEGVAEGQRDQRRDGRRGFVDGCELGGDSLELGQVVPGEEIGHVVVGIAREQQDDGLAAELVLELDVVDGHLGVGVEIAVLSGCELDPGEADGQAGSHDETADEYPLPVLAECNTGRTPQLFHLGHPPTVLAILRNRLEGD